MHDTLSRPDALTILQRDGQLLDSYLRQILQRCAGAPGRLIEAVEYSLLAGGKRIRPTLVLECAKACSPAGPLHSAVAAAAAIELIHTFSLVHDDLPAMDDDDLRRGRPTNHKVFGEGLAVLAGDAMVTLAFETLAAGADPELVGPLTLELAHASGPHGMIGGQVLDIDSERKKLSLDQLRDLHRRKTGALLCSACRLGGIAAGASESQLSALTSFGTHLGLAFQIVDDLLDVTASPEQMGKATGKDAARGKNTYPALMGLEASRDEAHRALNAALDALATFGPPAVPLRTLARFVVERQR